MPRHNTAPRMPPNGPSDPVAVRAPDRPPGPCAMPQSERSGVQILLVQLHVRFSGQIQRVH